LDAFLVEPGCPRPRIDRACSLGPLEWASRVALLRSRHRGWGSPEQEPATRSGPRIDGARSIGAARGSVQLEVDPDRLDGVLLVAALADELYRADRAERSLRLRVQHLGMPDARATAGTDESLPSALLAIEPDHAN